VKKREQKIVISEWGKKKRELPGEGFKQVKKKSKPKRKAKGPGKCAGLGKTGSKKKPAKSRCKDNATKT